MNKKQKENKVNDIRDKHMVAYSGAKASNLKAIKRIKREIDLAELKIKQHKLAIKQAKAEFKVKALSSK